MAFFIKVFLSGIITVKFYERALISLRPNFSRNVDVMSTMEYELRPPEYGLCKLCLASNFLMMRTMFLRSLYLVCSSLILWTEVIASEG